MLGALAQDSIGHLLAIMFIGGFLYFIPSLVAWNRSHHNTLAILLLNLFLGWTVLGWIAALIWAATNPAPNVRT